MSEEAVYFADKLAAEGYYALAPDLFRNTAADGMNVFWNIVAVRTTTQTRMDADSDAAYAFLKSTPNVDEGKIVSGPGFCFGGAQALIFGSRYKSAAVVTLYGTYISELDKEDTDAWGELPNGGPILGLYGKEDTRPGVEDVEKFRTAVEKKKMAHKISIYGEAANVWHLINCALAYL
jgi:carboxymethylenebutenolidase